MPRPRYREPKQAAVADVSPSLRAIDVEKGPLLLARGREMFTLDDREKQVLAAFLTRTTEEDDDDGDR